MKMKKKFNIRFKDENEVVNDLVKNEQIIKRNLKSIGEDGILSKIMIFLYSNDVCSVTEITELLSNYYKIPFDRSTIHKYLKQLGRMQLTSYYEAYYSFNKDNDERLKIVREKHKKFIDKLPTPFKKGFGNVQYHYVNGYGEKFIPWCAKNIGFKIDDEEKK